MKPPGGSTIEPRLSHLVEDAGGGGRAGVVISCEHGGNRIPAPYGPWFQAQQALLATHRGYDPGALLMAGDLAEAFSAPLVAATVSRLLVDLNRSIDHPRLHLDVVPATPAELRQKILELHYQPYRQQADNLVRQALKIHGSVIHVSSHSFTPELDGKVRTADIGLLYDPGRPGEVTLCQRWKDSFKTLAPELVVRRNYPYLGKGDGLTSWFRKRLPPEAYIGIELEINQKHVFEGGAHWLALRKRIIESLRMALAGRAGASPLVETPPFP